MEHGTAVDIARDELATKNRFESFKLGKGLPSSVAQKHSHTRSHSRNASISSSMPFTTSSKSTNATDPPSPAPTSKRNSHHKRRSSVSTRIESAELMGVSIPDLPPSTSDDNINLGEKDSIRRRALWALEGKPDVAFSKVEIPELSTPVMEKMMFDLATKSSQPQGTLPSYGPSITTLMANKRDSFKLLGPSSSSKDQLHTLVEEEEEEEENCDVEPSSAPAAPVTPITPVVAPAKATPARPRPAHLNLRPLSLTPENLVSNSNGLPTPSLTPSPRPGLKALALVTSGDESTNFVTLRHSTSPSPRPSLTLNLASDSSPVTTVEDKSNRRSSISYKSSTSSEGANSNYGLPTPDTATHPSFDRRCSVTVADTLRRRSNDSSSASADEDSFPGLPTQSRPLSASEQHFLFKSHNALLARITDLERVLSMRRMSTGGASTNGGSRPVSLASNFSSDYGSNEGPSDEMLRLVADLKAERDELKRDVDGWRTRVGDMEKQLSVVAGRVENERRDAWVARSMSGLLEVEKGNLERKLADVEKTLLALEVDKKALELENADFEKRVASLEDELERVKSELEQEKNLKRESAAANHELVVTPTPRTPESRARPLGFVAKRFASVDSDITQVEDSSDDSSPRFNFSLKSVVEDEEEDFSEEDNGLAGYEDEEESDVTLQSSSSFSSDNDDFPRSIAHLQDIPVSVTPRAISPPVIHAPRPTHGNRASISRTWTFPMGTQPLKEVPQEEPEVDRFFGCLEDDENNDSTPNSPSAYSYEKSKGLFASGFKYGADDEEAPFFFPIDAGVEGNSPKTLDVVQEEEEEEEENILQAQEDMFGEAGGIQITFTPPDAEEDYSFESQRSPSPSPVKSCIPTINFFDYDEEEVSGPFNFGRPVSSTLKEESEDDAVYSAPKLFNFGQPAAKADTVAPAPSMITPPSSLPRPTSPHASSPSSIPRAKIIKPFSFPDSSVSSTSTPPRPIQSRTASNPVDPASAYITPPSRRGGNMPSFIPQAISSPSPLRSASVGAKPKTGAAPSITYIRQPQRKPLMLANNNKGLSNPPGASHGSTFAPQIPTMLNSVMNTRSLLRSPELFTSPALSSHSEMKSVDLSDHFVVNTTNISASTTTTTPSQAYPVESQDRSFPFPLDTAGASSGEMPPLSSSFSSIMTSPLSSRISFQSFTNLLPLSWSQRSIAPATSLSGVANGFQEPESIIVQAHEPVTPLKRGFVSKEKQLEKLRCRMEREIPTKVRTSVSVWCRKCHDGEAVAL